MRGQVTAWRYERSQLNAGVRPKHVSRIQMRRKRLFLLVGLAAIHAGGLSAQRVAPALRGNWMLNVAASTFGPDGAPSAGTIRWTEHGWVLAMVFPNGYVYADAVVTDHGCALIGVPSDYTCRIDIVTPTHLRFLLKQGTHTRRVGDIELLDRNTTRTVHRVSPASGAPYTETTIWTRSRE